ncbi:MAG TPA: hypothetical protein VMQ58_01950 [Candidatus Saccharimonadales bacterium]|nr:hypothetical protein [Candidatus Saccharimonadales bacterium]
MNKSFLFILVFGIIFLSGCQDNGDTLLISNPVTHTVNNTFYDSSKSFQLQDFANSCSIISSSNVSNLSCSSGDSSFLRVNSTSGVWSLSCCSFMVSKCSWYNTLNITNFLESKQFADNILSTKYDSGYGAMCCNSQMSQCFFQKPMLNGSFQACNKEYDTIFVSVSFNNSTLEWNLTSCLDGFK